jgi:hypothetical protein
MRFELFLNLFSFLSSNLFLILGNMFAPKARTITEYWLVDTGY